MIARKTFLYYANLFSPNDNKKMTKWYTNILKINAAAEASFKFRLRKLDESGNYHLEEVKHINDLMSKNIRRHVSI